MRRRFGEVITRLADEDNKVIVIVADIGYRVFDEFREKHPDRFINMGNGFRRVKTMGLYNYSISY